MKIKIAHLYYDLLNLYGEQGNILALKDTFNRQNVEASVDYLTVGDKFNLKDYDIVYMGCGSLDNLLIVLDDIKKNKKEIKSYIYSNKYFISTGNSYLLLGKYLEINGEKLEGADIFPYYAKKNDKRLAGECFMEYNDNIIVGFQNRDFIVNNNQNHLFKVIIGNADNFKSDCEGYLENNFIGTQILGPLLIRNPKFLDNIVEKVLISKNLTFHEDKNTNLYKAYNEYLKNFYQK